MEIPASKFGCQTQQCAFVHVCVCVYCTNRALTIFFETGLMKGQLSGWRIRWVRMVSSAPLLRFLSSLTKDRRPLTRRPLGESGGSKWWGQGYLKWYSSGCEGMTTWKTNWYLPLRDGSQVHTIKTAINERRTVMKWWIRDFSTKAVKII